MPQGISAMLCDSWPQQAMPSNEDGSDEEAAIMDWSRPLASQRVMKHPAKLLIIHY